MIKKIILTCSFLLLCFQASASTQPLLNVAQFYHPLSGHYIETHLLIPAKYLTYNSQNSNSFGASIEVALQISEDTTLIQADKYLLNSSINDTSQIDFNLIDIQRYGLKAGKYKIELSFTDKNNTDNVIKPVSTDINISEIADSSLATSVVVLAESVSQDTVGSSYSKHGLNIVPNVVDFFPTKLNKLFIYTELYNANNFFGTEEAFLWTFKITNSKGVIANNISGFKRDVAKSVNVLIEGLDISNLPSGNYNVIIEVKNRANELLFTNQKFFYRSNKLLDVVEKSLNDAEIAALNINNTFVSGLSMDELKLYLGSCLALAENTEKVFIYNALESDNKEYLQKTLYSFWEKETPLNPLEGFVAYKSRVDQAQNLYGLSKVPAYLTDRGRVYLQYGPPNDIREFPFVEYSRPYEVWHYYALGDGQTNIKFVFALYQNMSNEDYLLVDSDAIGEIKQPNWQNMGQMQDQNFFYRDGLERQENYGKRIKYLYDID